MNESGEPLEIPDTDLRQICMHHLATENFHFQQAVSEAENIWQRATTFVNFAVIIRNKTIDWKQRFDRFVLEFTNKVEWTTNDYLVCFVKLNSFRNELRDIIKLYHSQCAATNIHLPSSALFF
ncbi:unnamed protein product [Caenorhabditis bovis]|uniref:Uncharacterized protein n=1 Tax=Caenorhabditis bovis TaxID=2654633 RepID=A0A8S1F3J3_9PELO|nr:unnamed protein product [Caenorhabditis bovis]